MTAALTALALVAFASNSILCRLALAGHEIDAATFTITRLLSGAGALLLLHAIARGSLIGRAAEGTAARRPWRARILAAAYLFLYAAPFSFAYVSIGAAIGALILFAAVQGTMLVGAIRAGERFNALEGVGLVLALAGLIYLVSPGLAAPSPVGSALMAIAGISWGLYSLQGRGSRDPLADTTNNFVNAVIPAVVLYCAIRFLSPQHAPRPTQHGELLAIASGALASGLGYTVWFAALRGLTAIRASMVQLAVPVLAAAGGVLLLGEPLTMRLVISAALILGGLAIALAGRGRA
jgi:drug/metabolite transporter (DMT)-like permease